MSLTVDKGVIFNNGELIYEPDVYSLIKNRPELIQKLPKDYFLHLSAVELHRVWNKISEQLKGDKDLLERLPCWDHYNRPEDIVHIDGPPPPKFRCYTCNSNKLRLKK